MENDKIKELENFADDFNKRLQLSEVELEENEIQKKLNVGNIKNSRNKFSKPNSLNTSPIRSKSLFRPVIKIFV